MGEVSGDYVRLGDSETGRIDEVAPECSSRKCRSMWWWARLILLCVFVLACVVAFLLFAGPVIIKKVIIPILNWVATISRPVLAWILFACFALFPAVLVPSFPCMWISGVTFGYGYGFLLIMAGISIGMSLPFFIGSLFRTKLHKWLEKWPKKAAIVRLAGEGDWFHQFRAVVLIRISPFPYIIFNYAAVATNVTYGPYISGSMIGTVPGAILTIYSGRLIQSLADATNYGGLLSVQQVIYDAIGFSFAFAATVAITIYAKKALQTLQFEDELS